MTEDAKFDLKQAVLLNSSFGPREIQRMQEEISADSASFQTFRDAIQELETKTDNSPASMVRLGVCHYLQGKFQTAIETLEQGDGGALARFYQGQAYLNLGQYETAITALDEAAKAGYNIDQVSIAKAQTQRLLGDPEAALHTLNQLSGAVEQTAAYLAQRAAAVAALGDNPDEVVALYERAVENDRMHQEALFGLAIENDRRGNDSEAIELYTRAVNQFPSHIGSLINLGILYEDHDRAQDAAQCYQRILDIYPTHERAQLYLKDTEASSDQYYDEEAQKRRDKLTQILNIPVTDFELSVRSRNCLEKLGAMSLGDLARCTEQELLGSKNFGETSLVEIRHILESKGLRLGMYAAEKETDDAFDITYLTPENQELLDRPFGELGISVRARKCLSRLGIVSVGDLVRKTGDDLLECKNFGITSLNEVREALANHNLKIRGD